MLGIPGAQELTFGEKRRVHDVQPLQILPVLPAEAAIRLPDPIPPRRVLASRGEEYDGIVGLDIQVEVSQYPSAASN
jgi:hypothetical protein